MCSDILHHPQHRALTHRGVPALEHVVLRQPHQGRLEEGELVGHERVDLCEPVPSVVVAVRLGTIDEIEQGAETRVELVVQRIESGLGVGVLTEQTLLDYLLHVVARQLHACGEAGLDLGEVVALGPSPIPDDTIHVLLAGDTHPCAPVAARAQRLHDRLQVQHELGVGADELADLVHHEQQAMPLRLSLQPLGDLIGEVLNG